MDKVKSQISYGKNVYGKEEISCIKRIKQTTRYHSVSNFEKKIAKKFNKNGHNGKFC